MAQTTCGKCGNTRFEMKEVNVTGSNYRHNIIQCKNCGVPVAATEYFNIGHYVTQIAHKLGIR